VPRFLKRIVRGLLRFYLTNTPIKKGRYPLMMLLHKYVSEPITVEVKTKDRGTMKLDLQDEAQYPLYYNIYEWKDTPTIRKLVSGSRTVLDIGGNVGQMAMLFAQYAKKVYTFEPIPEKAERIVKQIELNDLEAKVFVHRIALSSTPGMIKFELPTIENEGIGSTVIRGLKNARIVEVEADTLDHFVTTHTLTDIDFIKMDIEGGELYALQGMKDVLSTSKPIVILEMTLSMMKMAGYSPKDILDLMSANGYSCYMFEKRGLSGPHTTITPQSENYCFLTAEHVAQPHINDLIK